MPATSVLGSKQAVTEETWEHAYSWACARLYEYGVKNHDDRHDVALDAVTAAVERFNSRDPLAAPVSFALVLSGKLKDKYDAYLLRRNTVKYVGLIVK